MIPVLLVLEGVYSYRNRTEIDFQPMVDSGIFGIFGKVGSGKSAIIEAITFSLYGKTDRFGKNEFKRNMINLKSKKLYIEFHFKSGKDNTLYKTITTAKRRNHSEDVENYIWKTYRQAGDDWVSVDIKKDLSEIIGIDYDSFKKSIIIQQGKFLEFLQLDPSKRREMLMSLFKLDNFDLSDRVKKLIENNDRLISTLEGKLSGVKEIDENTLEATREKLSDLHAQGELLKKDIDALIKEEKKLDAQKKIHDTFINAKKKKEELVSKQSYYEEKRFQLETCRKYTSLFKDKFRYLDGHNAKISQKTDELDKLKKEELKLKMEGENILVQYEKAKKQFDTKSELKQRENEFQKAIEAKEMEESISLLAVEIDNIEIELHEAQKKITECELNLEKLRQQTEFLHRSLDNSGDPLVIQEALKWYEKREQLESRLTRTVSELSDIENESKTLITGFFQKLVSIDNHKMNNTGDFLAYQSILSELQVQYNEIMQKQVLLTEKMKLLDAQIHLQVLAESLSDGKPCPLCGSETHPNIAQYHGINNELSELTKEKSEVDEILELIQKDINLSREISGALNEKENRSRKIKEEINTLQFQLNQQVAEFRFPPFQPDDKSAAILAFEKMVQATEDLKKLAPSDTLLNDEKKALEKEEKGIREKFDNKKNQFEILRGTYEKSLSGFTRLSQEEINNYSEFELKTQHSELIELINRIDNDYESAGKMLSGWKDEMSGISARLNAAVQTLDELVHDRDSLSSEIIQLMETETNFTSPEDIRSLIEKSSDLEKEKKEIDQFFEEILVANKQCEELEAQLEKTGYDDSNYDKLILELSEKKNRFDINLQEIGQTEGNILKMEKDLIQKAEWDKEMRVFRARESNLNTLKSLFSGRSFVNYVSTSYLMELCNTANERFEKLTQNQLRLELTENNEFIIRDYLNDGKLRDFKSLSGGQAFQAALCLALALSEKIQEFMQVKDKLFFMDEGFGTLDNDTLETVFQTLKHLRNENRIVGVISHVEALQEQMDMYLTVTNKRPEGSTIKESWK